MPTAPTPSDDLPQPSRFIVGIDLGTTNSAVGYVDTDREPWRVETFRVPQLVDVGQVEALETLPSFHYQPVADEATAAGLRLPWSREAPPYTVGVFAREQGSRAPARLIASAKSWLCHSGVDRTADLLPWQGAADVERLSPVTASARYLRHIRDAWNAQFQGDPLQDQDLVLTLPASFDEVARELTVQAAAAAGLPRVVLIEEPQAAFYAWLDAHHQDWEQRVEPGQKILVCDIGGGTTDFTLIRVRHGEGDKVQFHRVAVGDHLILGGDNQDLALAKHLEDQLGGSLQPHQWAVLVRICRRLKEEVLTEACPPQLTFNLPGSGAKLIGGGVRVEVDRDQVRPLLLDGFFPFVGLDDKPRKLQSGFREFGLPYAPDPAVTRYLAAFLTAHRHAGEEAGHRVEQGRAGGADPARPDIVLLNGGVFNSPLVRQRLLDVLQSWFRAGDPELVADPAGQRPPGFGRGPWRRLLRHRAAGQGGADRRGAGPHVLHRRRERSAVGRLPGSRQRGTGTSDRSGAAAVRVAGAPAGRVSAVRLQHPVDRRARRVAAGGPRTDETAAADPHRVADPRQETGRHDVRPTARPADRDRHAGLVVQRSRLGPPLAAAVRRPFRDPDRQGRPADGGRGRGRDRGGGLAAVRAGDRRHVRSRGTR